AARPLLGSGADEVAGRELVRAAAVVVRGDAGEEGARVDFEGGGEAHEGLGRGAGDAAFDLADAGPADLGELAEILERDAETLADLADAATDLESGFRVDSWHRS